MQITSYELWVKSLKVPVEIEECEFKFTSYELKSTGWSSWVTTSTLRVTSSNPRVTTSNPLVLELFNQWKLK